MSTPVVQHVETIEKGRANMRVPPLLLNFVAFVFAVAVWWAIAAAKLVVLPGPLEVFQRALELIANGQLPLDIISSLRREDIRLSPEFAGIRNQVWHAVYHQNPQINQNSR